MLTHYPGELAALATAVFWTLTALAFETAARKVGSLAVNLIRLFLAMLFFGIFGLISNGSFFPTGAGAHQWIWLSVSGLIGFVLGDLFLFQSYVVISARISMLIMALAPPIAAITGWILMGETLDAKSLAGMVITFFGISLAILSRKDNGANNSRRGFVNPFKLKYPAKGVLLALGGAAGQGIGLVLSKYGMADYDPFAASQIRVLTGVTGFVIVISVYGYWRKIKDAVVNLPAMKKIGIGAFFGPFMGVSFSLIAVKHTSSGIASTIMSIVPVLIIVPSVFIRKEKISWHEVLGAVVAVAGVTLFFI